MKANTSSFKQDFKKIELVKWLAQTKVSKLGDVLKIYQTGDFLVNSKMNVEIFC